ncbi:MAG: AbrB/MazE/SpoVT family DNA-binding domain-containing protein [Candidatus Geothermarchaeales archaeon]
MGWFVTLNGKGRILIPREVRDNLGLEKGDGLWLELKDSEMVIKRVSTEKGDSLGEEDLAEFLRGN